MEASPNDLKSQLFENECTLGLARLDQLATRMDHAHAAEGLMQMRIWWIAFTRRLEPKNLLFSARGRELAKEPREEEELRSASEDGGRET
jgi:hypothetical protein